jgi:hypothetical protein
MTSGPTQQLQKPPKQNRFSISVIGNIIDFAEFTAK